MKLIWCHEVSYLEKPVYEYQDFAERLAARGHEVEVIDFNEQANTSGASTLVSRTGVGRIALSGIPHHNWPAAKYIEARLRFRRMLKERLRRGDVDGVFVYSIFINGTQAVELAREASVPVIYRVLDAYHRLRTGAVAQALLKSGERYVYLNADRIFLTNEKMAEYVSQVSGSDISGRMQIIDHGVDSSHFAPRRPDPELCSLYGIGEGDIVAVFLGTTYAFSGLVNLVRRLPEALQRFPALKVVIVGAGEQDAELASTVEQLGLGGKVILTGMVSYADVPRFLSLGTVALNPFELNDITRDIIPIKILQYQAAGLPVVSTPLPDLVRKHPPGESGVEYSASHDAESFFRALAEAISDPGHLRAVGLRGIDFVSRCFSVEHAVDQIESAFLDMNSEPRTP